MLQPLRIEVDCVFECPECKCETWYTIRELQHRKHMTCPCGHKSQIHAVKSVELIYAGNVKEQLDKSGKRTGPVVCVDDFAVSLVSLGWKKSDAYKLIQQHQDAYTGDDNQFLTFLLQQGT